MRSIQDPWQVSEAEFPRTGGPSEKLRHLLNYAVLAPSDHNTQPWRFRLAHGSVDVFADRSRALPVVDPADRELVISCGAALYQLRLAIRYFGFADRVALFPDAQQPDLLARVALGEPQASTEGEVRRFRAMARRRSNRAAFDDRAVAQGLVAALHDAVADEPVWFHEIASAEHRSAVAGLVAEGDRIQFSDPAFRQELAAWIRPNGSPRRDGIPGYALGMGNLVSRLAPFAIRRFDMGSRQARKDRGLVLGAPLLAVLGTARDDPRAWLEAGQAMAKVHLQACANGLSASYMNEPVQVAELRPQLRDLLQQTGYPQLLLRFGYGPQARPTPRRPVSDVLQE